MNLQEISEAMSDAEGNALEAFATCAAGFDAFNKAAANVVRDLLQQNADLREALAAHGIPDPTSDKPQLIVPARMRECEPDDTPITDRPGAEL